MTDVSEPDDMPTYTTSRRSADLNELFTALAKAQGAMSNAEKTGENPAFKRGGEASKYATLASVLDAIRVPFAANGLALTQWPRTNGAGVEVETVLSHASGQYMRDTLWLPCPQMSAHAAGSLITYLRRYSAMACVGIAPSDEDDGNLATEAHKPGVPGSAAGGTDFRPATRRMPTSNWVDDAMNDGIVDQERTKGTLPLKPANGNGKPPAPTDAARAEKIATKSKEWVTTAVATLKLSGQSVDSLSRFLADHAEQIRFLEDHAPAQHDYFFEVYNSALETARARVS